jgi:predicted transcriptional regulator
MNIGSMAYSDSQVLQTLNKLIEERQTGKISQSEISDASGVDLRTVKRALKRLKLTGLIMAEFTPGVGYSYRIADGYQASLRN